MAQDLATTVPGKDCLVYRSTGASFGSPTWVAISHIQDLTRADQRSRSDVSGKGEDIKTFDVGARAIETSFKLVCVRADASQVIFAAALVARTPIQLLVLNGTTAVNGAKGINADWYIEKFDESQPLDGNLTYDVTIVPAKTANAPTTTTISV